MSEQGGIFKCSGRSHSAKWLRLVVILYHDQDDTPVLGFDYDDQHNHSPVAHSTTPNRQVRFIRVLSTDSPAYRNYPSEKFLVQNLRIFRVLRGDKALVWKRARSNHVPKCIYEEVQVIPPIEAERHLVKVCRKMFRAKLVPRSHDATLEKRECAFNRIGVDISDHVSLLVLNRLVFSGNATSLGRVRVRHEFIRNKHFDILGHVSLDKFRKRSGGDILGLKEAEFSATLPNAEHDLLCGFCIGHCYALLFPAEVGFIHFHDSAEYTFLSFNHCGSNPMAKIPCGAIATDSESTLHLIGRKSLASLTKKQDGLKPFLKWDMGILKDGSDGCGKLILALATLKFRLGRKAENLLALATRANDAFRPTKLFQEFMALSIGRIFSTQFGEVHI